MTHANKLSLSPLLLITVSPQEEIKFPARLSDVAKSLLSGLLTKDPLKRYASKLTKVAMEIFRSRLENSGI